MNTIPGLPSGVLPTAPVTPVMSTADLTRLAAALRNQAAGALLNGLIVGHDRAGATLLRLENGNVVGLRLPSTVPNGTAVTIELQTNAGQTQAVLLSTRPPADAATAAQRQPAAPQPQFRLEIPLGGPRAADEPPAHAARQPPVAQS